MIIAIVCSLILGFLIGYVAGATPLSNDVDPVDESNINFLKKRSSENAGAQKKPDADR